MSLILKQIFCNHYYQKLTDRTVFCKKCGKIRQLPCEHEWEVYSTETVRGVNGSDYGREYTVTTFICQKCGEFKAVRSDGRKC